MSHQVRHLEFNWPLKSYAPGNFLWEGEHAHTAPWSNLLFLCEGSGHEDIGHWGQLLPTDFFSAYLSMVSAVEVKTAPQSEFAQMLQFALDAFGHEATLRTLTERVSDLTARVAIVEQALQAREARENV